MGYDVSYHPVDLDFIFERIVPCLLGHKDVWPLVEEAIVRERVRFRVKEWARGAFDARYDSRRDPPLFEPYVHLWGRPFLIAAQTPDHVCEQIDAYLAATTLLEVDRIARDNVRRLELHVPEPTQAMPSRDSFVATIAPEIFGLADAIVLTLAARFRPGWMERGYVWPTRFMDAAKLDTRPYFEPPWSLFPDELRDRLDDGSLRSGIHENYMVGGLVDPSAVSPLHTLLRREEDALLARPREDDWEDGARCALGKLDEALAYAERHHLAFAEATEVYSAPMGIVN